MDDDGSVRGAVRISLARSDLAPETAAAELMATRVRAGEQVLTFVPSRRLAEEVARSAETSVSAGPAGAEPGSVLAYRAGYLANDRRLIERGLADGTVRGVAATNALELGVDIAGLDTVVLCGYPGSRAAFWQQAGRAGRRGAAAEVVLIARANPLDAYLLDHPAALFDQPVETAVLDPASPSVLGPQLAAAAQELPLRPGDERWFGPGTWALVARLTERGLLRRRPDGWFWTAPQRAVDRISLRSTEAHTIDIVEEPTGRVLGTVGLDAADLVVHPGAVYLHQGDSYLCDDDGWDVEAGEVIVRAARPGYLTQPVVDAEVSPGSPHRERTLGTGRLAYGSARVSSRVTGFLRRDELTGRVWDTTPLDRPERVLSTAATILTVTAEAATPVRAAPCGHPRCAEPGRAVGAVPASVRRRDPCPGAPDHRGAARDRGQRPLRHRLPLLDRGHGRRGDRGVRPPTRQRVRRRWLRPRGGLADRRSGTDRGVLVRERLPRLHPRGGMRVEPCAGQGHRSAAAGHPGPEQR